MHSSVLRFSWILLAILMVLGAAEAAPSRKPQSYAISNRLPKLPSPSAGSESKDKTKSITAAVQAPAPKQAVPQSRITPVNNEFQAKSPIVGNSPSVKNNDSRNGQTVIAPGGVKKQYASYANAVKNIPVTDKPGESVSSKGNAGSANSPMPAKKQYASYADALRNGLPSDKASAKAKPVPQVGVQPLKPGKKPRCKLSRSKGKRRLRKRKSEEDCEEWDDNAPPMTGTSGAPNVANDNMGFYGVSGKWRYTPEKQGNTPIDPARLRDMSQRLSHNQVKYFQEIHDNRANTPVPWKHRPPPVLALQAESNGNGWIVRGASNQVLKPGSKISEVEPKTPTALSDLYKTAKAQRVHGNQYGLHGEEVNAAERAHEGKKPFEGTLNVAHETLLPYDPNVKPEPLRACDRSCAKQIEKGGGRDANDGFPDTKGQMQLKASSSKKRKKGSKPDSDDSYSPGVGDVVRRWTEAMYVVLDDDDFEMHTLRPGMLHMMSA